MAFTPVKICVLETCVEIIQSPVTGNLYNFSCKKTFRHIMVNAGFFFFGKLDFFKLFFLVFSFFSDAMYAMLCFLHGDNNMQAGSECAMCRKCVCLLFVIV